MLSNLSKHLITISFEVVNSNIWWISFTSTDSVKCNGSTVADFSKSSSLQACDNIMDRPHIAPRILRYPVGVSKQILTDLSLTQLHGDGLSSCSIDELAHPSVQICYLMLQQLLFVPNARHLLMIAGALRLWKLV